MAIGYACLTVNVEHTKLSSCILKNATPDHLRSLIHQNLTALNHIIEYNRQNQIKLFRISSDIIPFGSHPVNQLNWWKEFQTELYELGKAIKDANIRVTMHPGQYTILNSPDSNVVERAVLDLIYHDRFLSSLGMEADSKIILHIGGAYGDKKEALKRFHMNFSLLPEGIKNRLILENDERIYNIEEVLQTARLLGIPAVFDNLHHSINSPMELKSIPQWITECAHTWRKLDGKQKIHYSQQRLDGKPGSHSETIEVKEFICFYDQLEDKNIDIMLEVKDKNVSAVKCIQAVEERVLSLSNLGKD